MFVGWWYRLCNMCPWYLTFSSGWGGGGVMVGSNWRKKTFVNILPKYQDQSNFILSPKENPSVWEFLPTRANITFNHQTKIARCDMDSTKYFNDLWWKKKVLFFNLWIDLTLVEDGFLAIEGRSSVKQKVYMWNHQCKNMFLTHF